MANGCHTGFKVFFTTSVLWQIVNLEKKKNRWKSSTNFRKHRQFVNLTEFSIISLTSLLPTSLTAVTATTCPARTRNTNNRFLFACSTLIFWRCFAFCVCVKKAKRQRQTGDDALKYCDFLTAGLVVTCVSPSASRLLKPCVNLLATRASNL